MIDALRHCRLQVRVSSADAYVIVPDSQVAKVCALFARAAIECRVTPMQGVDLAASFVTLREPADAQRAQALLDAR